MALRTRQERRPAHQGLPVCRELVWGRSAVLAGREGEQPGKLLRTRSRCEPPVRHMEAIPGRGRSTAQVWKQARIRASGPQARVSNPEAFGTRQR